MLCVFSACFCVFLRVLRVSAFLRRIYLKEVNAKLDNNAA